MQRKAESAQSPLREPFPRSMVLTPVRRNPLELPAPTVAAVLERPLALGSFVRANPAGRVVKVSIVVVTFNNYLFNRISLESLLGTVDLAECEIIVVDNASTDGTRLYLKELSDGCPQVRVVLNSENLGFAPAVNKGLGSASGRLIVLLNNDTLMVWGWLERLVAHLEEPGAGMVGPVTNRTGNEAQIEASYHTYGELLEFAAVRARTHKGRRFEIDMLAMFCVAMRREVYERVGPLDERFEVGFFEDDDYAIRVRDAGYRILCAEDTFVHHFSQASFGKLAAAGKYGDLFQRNRRRWEAKWGRKWMTHRRRETPDHEALVQRILTTVSEAIPPGASVLVVSKGDPRLVDLPDRVAGHFPQSENGEYAGYYPGDGGDAVRALETLRRKGSQFLLIPAPSLWWLDHYREFADHLRSSFEQVPTPPDTCVVFDIRESGEFDVV